MANGLSRLGITEAQILESSEVNEKLDQLMEEEYVPAWKSNSPAGFKGYRDSVRVTKKARNGKGQIGSDHDLANIVEYGSQHTPEYAPRAKTEEQYR